MTTSCDHFVSRAVGPCISSLSETLSRSVQRSVKYGPGIYGTFYFLMRGDLIFTKLGKAVQVQYYGKRFVRDDNFAVLVLVSVF